MKYVPCLLGIDAEISALQSQNFSTNVMPFIQIVKDKKQKNSSASILDDLEKIIASKKNNNFILTIPRNYDLSKQLKKPIQQFYLNVDSDPLYISSTLNKFSIYPNVIPTIEVDFENYHFGDLKKMKDSLNKYTNKYCYRVNAKKLSIIYDELKSLISANDYMLYDIDNHDLFTSSVKREKKSLKNLKKLINFKTIVIKQIYKKELTFPKFPDGKILPKHDAYDLIDLDFYDDFKPDFDYYGDWAGIRNNAIYNGGRSYPAYLTIELDAFDHHAFKGTALKTNSFGTTLLPKYEKSDHWNNILNNRHKRNCNGCRTITEFINSTENPNSAVKWKTVTISHFIETMDYKITNSLI